MSNSNRLYKGGKATFCKIFMYPTAMSVSGLAEPAHSVAPIKVELPVTKNEAAAENDHWCPTHAASLSFRGDKCAALVTFGGLNGMNIMYFIICNICYQGVLKTDSPMDTKILLVHILSTRNGIKT